MLDPKDLFVPKPIISSVAVLYLSFVLLFSPELSADQIKLSGNITQSTSDGTGPAVNNPTLNNINDGDAYTLLFNFSGSISGPGTYDLTGGSLVFADPTAPAVESDFSTISLTVTPDGSNDDISAMACLATGGGCLSGNSLSLDFAIAASSLNSLNIPASPIPVLYPLDLLEDDGTTDIHGTVTNYSYLGSSTVSPTPEPTSMLLFGSGLLAVALKRRNQKQNNSTL